MTSTMAEYWRLRLRPSNFIFALLLLASATWPAAAQTTVPEPAAAPPGPQPVYAEIIRQPRLAVPHTAGQLRRLLAVTVGRAQAGTLPDFSQTPMLSSANERRRGREREGSRGPLVIVRRSALWHPSGERELRLGADSDHLAWFLFLDGVPVCDWRTGSPAADGVRLSQPLRPAAGAHRLDLVSVSAATESLPVLLGVVEGGAAAPLPAAELTMPPEAAKPKGSGPLAGGRPLLLLGAAGEFPLLLVQAGEAAAAVSREWPRLVNGCVELLLAGRPLLISEAEPLCLRLRAALPKELAPLLPELRLRARQLDAAGRPRREELASPGFAAAAAAWQTDLDPETAVLVLQPEIAGQRVGPALRIRIVYPDSQWRRLEAAGGGLSVDGEPAVLRLRPDGHPAVAGGGRSSAKVLTVLDDFWTLGGAPGADLLPEDFLQPSLPDWRILRRHTGLPEFAGVEPAWRKFMLLAKLEPAAGSRVFWAVGLAEMRGGQPLERTLAELRFLVQATRGRGAEAVLLTLPELPFPEAGPAAFRAAALGVKELAWRLRTPVVDAFSAARLDGGHAAAFAGALRTPQGEAGLAVPDNAGRQALFGLLPPLLEGEPEAEVRSP